MGLAITILKVRGIARHCTYLYRLPARLLLTSILLQGCTDAPSGVTPVDDFEVQRFLGDWYEIARLDHSFERGLANVSANYSLRDDGGISVINSGISSATGELSQSEGRAYFVDTKDRGHLKVSFFGPFYGAYVVFEIGSDYNYAFVAGNNRDYLWLLARQPNPPQAIKDRFAASAAKLDFLTDQLIWVSHSHSAAVD